MHIVLIRFSSLGDIVLQTPLIAWFKKINPETKITFVTSKEFSNLVENHPLIDHVLYHERSSGIEDIKQLRHLAQEIKKLKVDFIIDLHNTLRAKLIRFFSFNIPSLKVNKRDLARKILIYFKIDFLKNLPSHHERVIKDFEYLFADSYERTELELSLMSKTAQACPGLSSIPESFQKDVPQKYKDNYVVISPVASFEPKRWPIQYFSQLIDLFFNDPELNDFKIIILAGPGDDYCQQLVVSDQFKSRFENLQGKTNLKETNQILKYAHYVLTNDTGVGHMAEALGVPVASIFGPTSPSFGFRPHLKGSQVIQFSAPCSPCSATGAKPCYRKDHMCMQMLTTQTVFTQFKQGILRGTKC